MSEAKSGSLVEKF